MCSKWCMHAAQRIYNEADPCFPAKLPSEIFRIFVVIFLFQFQFTTSCHDNNSVPHPQIGSSASFVALQGTISLTREYAMFTKGEREKVRALQLLCTKLIIIRFSDMYHSTLIQA